MFKVVGAVVAFHVLGFVLLYAVLRLQAVLPLNPTDQAAVAPDLAFNTATSFITNQGLPPSSTTS